MDPKTSLAAGLITSLLLLTPTSLYTTLCTGFAVLMSPEWREVPQYMELVTESLRPLQHRPQFQDHSQFALLDNGSGVRVFNQDIQLLKKSALAAIVPGTWPLFGRGCLESARVILLGHLEAKTRPPVQMHGPLAWNRSYNNPAANYTEVQWLLQHTKSLWSELGNIDTQQKLQLVADLSWSPYYFSTPRSSPVATDVLPSMRPLFQTVLDRLLDPADRPYILVTNKKNWWPTVGLGAQLCTVAEQHGRLVLKQGRGPLTRGRLPPGLWDLILTTLRTAAVVPAAVVPAASTSGAANLPALEQQQGRNYLETQTRDTEAQARGAGAIPEYRLPGTDWRIDLRTQEDMMEFKLMCGAHHGIGQLWAYRTAMLRQPNCSNIRMVLVVLIEDPKNTPGSPVNIEQLHCITEAAEELNIHVVLRGIVTETSDGSAQRLVTDMYELRLDAEGLHAARPSMYCWGGRCLSGAQWIAEYRGSL